jgi:hypothetical protein
MAQVKEGALVREVRNSQNLKLKRNIIRGKRKRI